MSDANDTPEMPEHFAAWEDGGYAGLSRCGDTRLHDTVMVEVGETTVCPVCGRKLTLKWDVRIVVVP